MAERRNRAFVARRRDTIVGMLREREVARVSELAHELGISALTVRRDLDALERAGVIRRSYGKATLSARGGPAGTGAAMAKRSIARAAGDLPDDNSLLFVNTSSTALMAIDHIKADGVTVVTNSAHAESLKIPSNGMILMTGGEVRPPRGVLSGEFAFANIQRVAASACFVGCAGLSLAAGATSNTQQEAVVNALMVERSDKVILLMDSSKMGASTGFTYASLSDISLLITDTGLSDEDMRALLDAGVGEVRRVVPGT